MFRILNCRRLEHSHKFELTRHHQWNFKHSPTQRPDLSVLVLESNNKPLQRAGQMINFDSTSAKPIVRSLCKSMSLIFLFCKCHNISHTILKALNLNPLLNQRYQSSRYGIFKGQGNLNADVLARNLGALHQLPLPLHNDVIEKQSAINIW